MSAVTRRRPSTPSAATARPGRPATRPCGYAAILHFVDERGHRWAVLTNSPTRPGAAAISAVPGHVGQASCTSVDLPVGPWPAGVHTVERWPERLGVSVRRRGGTRGLDD